MRRWLLCASAALLTGCASLAPPVPVERATVTRCPLAAPAHACPDFPALGGDVTVEALEDAWIDARAAHAECAAALEEWRAAWGGCGSD